MSEQTSKTFGRGRLSFAQTADIDDFVDTLSRFERGEITPDQWRAYRLVRGTYGQRQEEDAQMLRVKIPAGILDGKQLLALANIAEQYSRGFGHITTRQNFQFHFMKLHEIEHAMRIAADVGLTTREACGNSVRTVTCCPYAGVSADEAFDPTPYAEAFTRYFLRHPLSSSLPRKFKVAFEGCSQDHAATAIHDIGFRAQLTADGQRVFRVVVGGGTAILCRSGSVIREALPASEILALSEALVRVFHRLGDREHRHKNRLKFLVKQLGWEAFHAEVERTLVEVLAEGAPQITELFSAHELPPELESGEHPLGGRSLAELATQATSTVLRGPGIHPQVIPVIALASANRSRWLRTNVRAQRQTGYSVVTVRVTRGDLTAAQFRLLAELATGFGDGMVRTTISQNLVLRWIPDRSLPAVHEALLAIGLGEHNADTLVDVTSCPGAESCKLAVTHSRGLAELLEEYLDTRIDASDPSYHNATIKMSGCPNGCGQHHIATLGFQGGMRKVGDQAAPQYFVMLAGGTQQSAASDPAARFGKVVAKVPARRIPQVIDRLVSLFEKEGGGATFDNFISTLDVKRAKNLLADLEPLTPENARPEDFIDLGETQAFAGTTTEGECAA